MRPGSGERSPMRIAVCRKSHTSQSQRSATAIVYSNLLAGTGSGAGESIQRSRMPSSRNVMHSWHRRHRDSVPTAPQIAADSGQVALARQQCILPAWGEKLHWKVRGQRRIALKWCRTLIRTNSSEIVAQGAGRIGKRDAGAENGGGHVRMCTCSRPRRWLEVTRRQYP